MGEVCEMVEMESVEVRTAASVARTPPISVPPFQLHSPSLTRSPLLDSAPRAPTTPLASRLITPLTSPMKKAIKNMQGYLEDVGHITKLDPQDAWLPITESRNGNAYYAAFHTLSSGIGFQALVLPFAFIFLGWTWGILCLLTAFAWQLYTLWLLVNLHESVPGTRYSRYLQLAMATFGEKRGKLLALFPLKYLSGGSCVALIMFNGATMKLFFRTVCGNMCNEKPLTTVEWYLVFTCLAIVIAQLPNLNSIAGVSLIGAITAVSYCTIIWILSVSKTRPTNVSYKPLDAKSDIDRICDILNALGIISFAFRGHNLVLEIQGTMPSSLKHPSRVPMWRGVKLAYLFIATCLFPLAIGGYWAYGNSMPNNNAGILSALYKFHGHETSRFVLGLTCLLIVINGLSSFQIYAMPIFDDLEAAYTRKKNKPCPRWLRAAFRALFGCIAFFIAVALPFLPSLAGLLGGIALPITLAYPCFMWIVVRKPQRYGVMCCVNWALGCLGLILSVLVTIAAVWKIVDTDVKFHFFRPQ